MATHRWSWLGAAFMVLLLSPLSTPAGEGKTRVALMNFACDDNSVRSTAAAEDLTTLLQAELAKQTDLDWVDRNDLEKAQNEFALANYGFADVRQTLKAGRWTRADWALVGRISATTAQGRIITLEIIDLLHA